MEWFNQLFINHSAVQTVIVLSLICSAGIALGKLHFKGISLGIAFVFFMGIMAGNMGLTIDATVLEYAQTFGLVIFVYTLGLYVGPNFFGAFRSEGVKLNAWSIGVILLGTIAACALTLLLPVSFPTMVGILCGATTNTPALGAAQQALSHLHVDPQGAALACAVTYPLGVLGVILAMIMLRKWVVKPQQLLPKSGDDDHTFVAQYVVVNPAIDGKTIAQLSEMSHIQFIISRIWRGNQAIVPHSTTTLHTGDNVLAITTDNEVDGLELFFGKKDAKDWNMEQIDWNHLDTNIESRVVVITRHMLNGKKLGSLQLRNTYGVNISRVLRGDTKLLATNDLRLQYGDRVTVVGESSDVDHAEKYLGNAVQTLKEPNLAAIFLGMILGLAIGIIPIHLPGVEVPVRMGIAGGPIIMGILVGAIGPRFHLISYTTRSASLMLRQLGMALYLASLGLESGSGFFSIVMQPQGLLWVGIGFVLTVIPVFVIGWLALRSGKLDFGTVCGILCGAMANPMALTYATENTPGESSTVTYATVYPLGMVLRVVIAQTIVALVLRL